MLDPLLGFGNAVLHWFGFGGIAFFTLSRADAFDGSGLKTRCTKGERNRPLQVSF